MAIDPEQIELSPEMKQALARLAEKTGKRWDEVLWEAIGASRGRAPLPTEKATFYDAMCDLIGVIEDAPTDLSSNPQHMEGFGRDR